MKVKEYIDSLVSKGRYHFTLKELKENLEFSKESIRVNLARLKKAGEIASPARGYYIVIPLEYRSLGSLPPDQFIPGLMKFWDIPYYVGLLSAGMYYGAAHQQPQVFQVMTSVSRENLEVGRVRVTFYMNKYLDQCPVREFNTARSVLLVSSPEATALDLVAYPRASAGFSNILTVLSELVESMDLEEFRKVLHTKRDVPVLQRLGYLLEVLEENAFANLIAQHLDNCRCDKVMLNPRNPRREGESSKRWKLVINEHIESDL